MSQTTHRRGRGGQGGHEPTARIRTRDARAMELATLGWSQQRIAADLGVSQAAVSKILKRVDERLLQDLRSTLERQKVRHTVRLEHLFTESIRAWDNSKADTTRRRQRKTDGTGTGQTVAELVVENRHGDPRYLNEARKAMADLRKLWGLDAPQQVDLQTPRNPYEGLSEDDLRTRLAAQTRLIEPPPSVDSTGDQHGQDEAADSPTDSEETHVHES